MTIFANVFNVIKFILIFGICGGISPPNWNGRHVEFRNSSIVYRWPTERTVSVLDLNGAESCPRYFTAKGHEESDESGIKPNYNAE